MKIVYENPWFKVVKDEQFHYVVEDRSVNGAAIFALIDESEVLLIKVNRRAHPGVSLEIPRGYGDPGETSAQCARRELLEETGYLVKEDNLHKLGTMRPNSAILSARIDIYLAKLQNSDKIDSHDDEVLATKKVPIQELVQLINTAKIEDAFTLSALAYYLALKAT